MFAYIYGSVLSSDNPRDIDIAVYLFPMDFEKLSRDGEISLSFAIPLEMDLEEQLKRKVDVQVLNRAPLSFRYRVITDGSLTKIVTPVVISSTYQGLNTTISVRDEKNI
jgi:predicted nucleotidyltransferase